MSETNKQIINMLDMLPEKEQKLAYEVIKRVVLAWDSDFTKITPQERLILEQADSDFANEATISHNDIDWK